MNVIGRVFSYEFRRQFRRKAFLFVSFGLPLLGILLFHGYQLYQQIRPAQNGDPADLNRAMTEQFRPTGVVDRSKLLKKPGLFSGLILYENEEVAQTALRENRIGAYFVVTADYLESGQIDMYFDRFNIGNLNTGGIKNLLVESLLAASGKQVEKDFSKRLQSRPSFRPHTIGDSGAVKTTTTSDTSFFLSYIFSLVMLFTSFMTSGYLMQSIVEEKETRVIEILLSSLRPLQLLVGKISALGLLGLIQMAAWAAAVIYLVGRIPTVIPDMTGLVPPTGGQIAIMVIYFVLGYLLLATLYASIGALATNMREGPQLAAFITIPFVIPMYALSVIAASPNGTLSVVLSLIPFTAPLTMVSRAAITDVPLVEVVASVTLLVLGILFAVWLAGRLFRVNTLLAGQLPRFRDILRLIRAG